MKQFIYENINFKTKPYITTLISLFFIFLPYGIIWILFGEGKDFFFTSNNININLNINWYDSKNFIYSWEFYTIFFSFLFLPIILWIFGKYIFKVLEIDSLPFFYLSCGFWIGVLLTGLMPNEKTNNFFDLIIIGKFIFIIFFSFIFFLISNFLIKFFVINSKNFSDLIIDFKKEDNTNSELMNSQKEKINNKKEKQKKETTWEV